VRSRLTLHREADSLVEPARRVTAQHLEADRKALAVRAGQHAAEEAGADAAPLLIGRHLYVVHRDTLTVAARSQSADRLARELDDRAPGDVERACEPPILVSLVPAPDRLDPAPVARVVKSAQELAVSLGSRSQRDRVAPGQQVAALRLHLALARLATEIPLDGQPRILQQPADPVGRMEVKIERDLDAHHVVEVEKVPAGMEREQCDPLGAERPPQLGEGHRQL